MLRNKPDHVRSDVADHFRAVEAFEEMGFIQDADYLFMRRLGLFDGALQIPFGIAAVEPGLESELVKKTGIRPTRGQFGIGQIQKRVPFLRKAVIKHPDQRGFATARFRHHHRKQLIVRGIPEPSDGILQFLRVVLPVGGDVSADFFLSRFFLMELIPYATQTSEPTPKAKQTCRPYFHVASG